MLKYRQAIISFCPDLTNPNAASIPAAVLFVGEVGEYLVGAANETVIQSAALDPLSAEILSDVPRFLKSQIEKVMTELGDQSADPEIILRQLHHHLRNSLHMAEILPELEAEVEDASQASLVPVVHHIMVQTMHNAIMKAGGKVHRPVAISPKQEMAAFSFWPIAKSVQEIRA